MIDLGLSLGLRSVYGPSAPAAKTYADFVEHITGLATQGEATFGESSALHGAYITTATSAFPSMVGSSWNSYFEGGDSNVSAIIRHGMPTPQAIDAQISSGRRLYFRINFGGGEVPYTGLSRNNYSSTDGPATPAASTCTQIIYWDGTQAWQMYPSLGLGPTPYTW
jgi:hypothetical protein